jgi:hypothetical protein
MFSKNATKIEKFESFYFKYRRPEVKETVRPGHARARLAHAIQSQLSQNHSWRGDFWLLAAGLRLRTHNSF